MAENTAASSDGIVIREMTQADVEEATEIISSAFTQREPLTACLAIPPHLDRVESGYVCTVAAKDGLSVVAVDTKTNKIVGVATSRVHDSSGDQDDTSDIDEVLKHYKPIYALFDTAAEVFADYPDYKNNPDSKVTMAMKLGVHGSYTGRGLGTKLRQATTDLAEKKGFDFVVAIATNKGSQRLYEKLNYTELSEVKYGEFEYDGQHPFAGITACTSAKLLMKKLSP